MALNALRATGKRKSTNATQRFDQEVPRRIPFDSVRAIRSIGG
jgi:hypothetical protein